MNPKIQKLKSEKEKLLAKKASIEERCNEIDAQVMASRIVQKNLQG